MKTPCNSVCRACLAASCRVGALARKRLGQYVGRRAPSGNPGVDVMLQRGRVAGVTRLPLSNRRIGGRAVADVRPSHPVEQTHPF